MKNYIISYDLRDRKKDYVPLYAVIKTAFPEYWHILEQTWLVKTDMTAKEIFKKIWPEFGEEDLVFVAEINHENCEGLIPRTAWGWLDMYQNKLPGASV